MIVPVTDLTRRLSALGLALCSLAAAPANFTEALSIQAQTDGSSWSTYGGTPSEQRFSPLSGINTETVKNLGLAWAYDLETSRGQESTPLLIDGVLYVSQAWSQVVALDAVTGRRLWHYDPKVPGEIAFKACCDVVNRGLAASGDRLFLGTLDGRLIALDRKTGQEVWSQMTVDPAQAYTITGAPRVIKGKVIIGNGGADYGVRGYITAYDAETGHQLWRFYTVPGDPAKGHEAPYLARAAKTWTGDWWKTGGGGTVWDSMAYDPELNTLFIGVGNGSPWNRALRSPGGGDNLYLSSIVALNPDTGTYKWHYQTTPGESWDFAATQSIILADLVLDGKRRKVLMQAPKNGFFYVIDRETGVPVSAQKFVPTTWATHIDPATWRPAETPNARYTHGPEIILPSPLGAHNWQPMAFHPGTGLAYIPAQDIPMLYAATKHYRFRAGHWNPGVDFMASALPDSPAQRAALRASLKGYLLAWDPVRQVEAWRVDHGGPWNGGVLATGGNLVFQGTAQGWFNAYRADTGQKLWSFDAQSGILAGAITYRLDGIQYVSVVVGAGGAWPLSSAHVDSRGRENRSRVLTFRLGGSARLPAVPKTRLQFPALPVLKASAAQIAQGRRLFYDNCSHCHGEAAVSGGVLPDLRLSAAIADSAQWNAIVLEGALKARGMVGFAPELTAANAQALRAYVAGEAERFRRTQSRR